MEVPQWLWLGLLSITVTDAVTTNQYTGQLEKLTSNVCHGSNNIACKSKITLTASGGSIDRGARTIPPNAMAMVAVANNQMLMDISISVQDLRRGDSISNVTISRERGIFVPLTEIEIKPIMEGKKRQFAKGQVTLDQTDIDTLRSGNFLLAVIITRSAGDQIMISGPVGAGSLSSPGLIIPKRVITPTSTEPSDGGPIQPTGKLRIKIPLDPYARNASQTAACSVLVLVSFLLMTVAW